MRLLALVTARGGSKGFPGKNLALLGNRPLVQWSHYTLAQFRTTHPTIETVLHLSTDSVEIAAAWPLIDRPRRMRPESLAGDDTASIDVALYELEQQEAEGRRCDAVLLLQPTTPLVALEDLDAMWRQYPVASSVMLVAETPHPVQWCLYRHDDGTMRPVIGEIEGWRRQHFKPTYLPIGVYLISADMLKMRRQFAIHGLSTSVIVPDQRAIDIDYPIDLDVAEAIIKRNGTGYNMTACIS